MKKFIVVYKLYENDAERKSAEMSHTQAIKCAAHLEANKYFMVKVMPA